MPCEPSEEAETPWGRGWQGSLVGVPAPGAFCCPAEHLLGLGSCAEPCFWGQETVCEKDGSPSGRPRSTLPRAEK